MQTFKSKKAVWWSVGVAAVLIGFFVAALLLPSTGGPPGGDAPDVRVPAMRNVPDSADSPNLELETKDE